MFPDICEMIPKADSVAVMHLQAASVNRSSPQPAAYRSLRILSGN
jgi:hypothetical protein